MSDTTTVIACLLCPEDAEGYHPEFTGDAARRAFGAHLVSAHGFTPRAEVQKTLSMHLKFDNGAQAHYYLFEVTPQGRGRRIGAQRTETIWKKEGRRV